MPKQTVEALVDGGKATAGPPLGPALGPLGVNIGQIIAEINKETESFKGMQVPVKVIVDSDTKEFSITVGTPPTASLLLKEAGLQKGAHNPAAEKIADLRIEQIIRVAKMKQSALLGKTMKSMVKEVIGTCNSIGILVNGMPAIEAIKAVNEGRFDTEIEQEKTELSAAEMKELEEEKKKLQGEIKERRAEFESKANDIINKMKGKDRSAIKHKLLEAEIPKEIIEELMPAEETAEGAAAPPKK
jgi:large subunit ribosomal protein L11